MTEAPVPGHILGVEDLDASLALESSSESFRFRYATTGPFGEYRESIGALYVPGGIAPTQGWNVISYAHGTTGISDSSGVTSGVRDEMHTEYLENWVSSGFALVMTEYAGIGTIGHHPYLNVRNAAANVIDVVRAGNNISKDLSTNWFAVGDSQGGHAAVAAASANEEMRRGLRLCGAAANGLPARVDALTDFADPCLELAEPAVTVFLLYIVAGLAASSDSVDIDSFLTPKGMELLGAARKMNYDELAEYVVETSIADILSRPLREKDFQTHLIASTALPTSGFCSPILVCQAEFDQFCPTVIVDEFVSSVRRDGGEIQYSVYNTDHYGIWTESQPEAISFAAESFANFGV